MQSDDRMARGQADAARGVGLGPASVALTQDDAAFIQSGLSILVAACGGESGPLPGFANGCVVDPARAGEVRLLLCRHLNAGVVAACANGSAVAATFANLAHRSLQLKASRSHVRAPEPGDLAALARQSALYRDWLQLVGFGDDYCALFAGYVPDDIVAIAFRPEQAFIQTPGPQAGEPLQP